MASERPRGVQSGAERAELEADSLGCLPVHVGEPVGKPSQETMPTVCCDQIRYTDQLLQNDPRGRGTVPVGRLGNLLNSDRWAARSGLVGGPNLNPVDPNYLIDGWGPEAVRAVFQRQTVRQSQPTRP